MDIIVKNLHMANQYTKTFCAIFIVCSFVLFTGCSKSSGLKGLVKVKGSITLDGAPLEGASIMLVPTVMSDTVRGASGTSDASGNFEITTIEKGDGAFPGDYKVTVVKKEPVGKVPTPEEMQAAAAKGQSLNVQYKSVIPDRYGASSTSGIAVKIESGQKDPIKIELTSK